MEEDNYGRKFEDLRSKAEEILAEKEGSPNKLTNELDEIIHELEVHQIELEMQNEALLETQIELEDSRRDYYELYDFAPLGYFTLDENGIIKRANLTGSDILGKPRKFLLNSAFIRYVAQGYKKTFHSHFHQVMKNHVKNQCEIELISPDKNSLFVSLDTMAVLDEERTFKEFRTIVTDISERKKMEKTLMESEERYSITLDAVNDGLWGWNISSEDAFFSPNYYRLLGYNPGEFPANYASWRLLLHPDDLDSVEKELQESVKSGRGFERDLRMKTKSGEWLWVSIRGKAIEKDSTEKATRMVGTLSDITERVNAEEKINKSLEEKEMLLKEIHHRVKNNLMIISSLLNLQSRYIKDKTSKDIFKESQNRARSMALIHERLYQTTNLKKIDFGDYIRTLSKELFRTYAGDFGLIDHKINVEDIFLDINTAIPLGLIVNELITNSLTHAFPDGMKGEISVDFNFKDDHYEFAVRDNGIGFPYDLNFQNTDSLGLQIVNSLTDQINGTIKLNRSHGTEFKITFKELGV